MWSLKISTLTVLRTTKGSIIGSSHLTCSASASMLPASQVVAMWSLATCTGEYSHHPGHTGHQVTWNSSSWLTGRVSDPSPDTSRVLLVVEPTEILTALSYDTVFHHPSYPPDRDIILTHFRECILHFVNCDLQGSSVHAVRGLMDTGYIIKYVTPWPSP